jgi:hypothetical protein
MARIWRRYSAQRKEAEKVEEVFIDKRLTGKPNRKVCG